MLFSGIPFLYYFLPLVLLSYFILPRRFENGVLLLSSLFFYAWGEGLLVILFALSIFLGWILGLLIEKHKGTSRAKLLTILSAVLFLGLLGYFKYTDFFMENLNRIPGISLPLPKIALPIGISFYTFQLLSYILDVYRGQVAARRNFVDFAAYVSMFPQLIAGPILRYADLQAQLTCRPHSLDRIAVGIRRFILGLGKKVLLANVLGELCGLYRNAAAPSILFSWMFAIAYMLQIYFDFSGYSDMAIGLGKIFGFDFMENFNYPYISRSITEFWRRWHISLGSWFRDYVYIPLGGNRKGIPRQLINIFVVWMLTGLWHGASWNFVLWGLFYGVLLTLEKLWLKPVLDRHPAMGHLYVLTAVMLGFLLFNANNLDQAAENIRGLFAFGKMPLSTTESLYYLRSYGLTLLFGILGAAPWPKNLVQRISETRSGRQLVNFLEPLLLAAILLISTAYLVDGSFNPFLYFRF